MRQEAHRPRVIAAIPNIFDVRHTTKGIQGLEGGIHIDRGEVPEGREEAAEVGVHLFRGKPRHGNNEIFKSKVGEKLLAETLR